MGVDPEVTALVVGAIVAAVPTILGGLALRVVRGYDRTLTEINHKLDKLGGQDTARQVEIADLRARVAHLELMVHNRSPGSQSRATT